LGPRSWQTIQSCDKSRRSKPRVLSGNILTRHPRLSCGTASRSNSRSDERSTAARARRARVHLPPGPGVPPAWSELVLSRFSTVAPSRGSPGMKSRGSGMKLERLSAYGWQAGKCSCFGERMVFRFVAEVVLRPVVGWAAPTELAGIADGWRARPPYVSRPRRPTRPSGRCG